MRQRRAEREEELGGQRERRCVERARAVPAAGSNGGDQPLEHHTQCGGLGGEHCKGHPLAGRRACDTGRPPPTEHSPGLDMQRGRERLTEGHESLHSMRRRANRNARIPHSQSAYVVQAEGSASEPHRV
jgi:hypothetical protein